MKLLLITFAIRMMAEIISNKRKEIINSKGDEKNKRVLHPAEFAMR